MRKQQVEQEHTLAPEAFPTAILAAILAALQVPETEHHSQQKAPAEQAQQLHHKDSTAGLRQRAGWGLDKLSAVDQDQTDRILQQVQEKEKPAVELGVAVAVLVSA
jgi:hypothetical protein